MASFSLLTRALALVACTATAVRATTDMTISNVYAAPDGFNRSIVSAGGGVIGQLVSGNTGENFQINVMNKLTDNSMDLVTSVHWHGLFQKTTNDMDGVSFVTQCPLTPDADYTYNFTPVGQAGTFWYHSHYNAQYCDGLRGPLVVYDPHDPHKDLYEVDNETTVITLADWYHTPSPELIGGVPVPDATLINGKGRNAVTPTAELAVIPVLTGFRYRMRLMSIACHPNYNFSIDGHALTIIEVDGVNVKPYTVNEINILIGQRYSFVLTANQKIDNYWIRAVPSIGAAGNADGINSAILRYFGAPLTEPTTSQVAGTLLNEQDLIPLVAAPAPGKPQIDGADVNINLAVTFTNAFAVNGVSWASPEIPVLLQIMSGATTAQSLLPSGSVYTLPSGKSVQISIPGGAVGGPHPIHLHGHNFAVVRSAGNDSYNYVNPPVRDVVSMGTSASDNLTIRFMTDNAGPWFLHCHIDWHLTTGFGVVMAEDAPQVANVDHTSTAWNNLCPAYNKYIDNQS